jgi:hypothetical protein
MPETTVEIGAFTGLTLDDPVLGKLDENPLDGAIAFEEIPQGLFSVSTTRGRNRDLDRTSAGQVSVSLHNQDRFFDPLNDASPFQSAISPRLPVRVKTEGTPVFAGFIDNWSFSYEPTGVSVASFTGSDGFSIFARNINAGGTAVEELTGARLNRILDQPTVNWPADQRDIEDGNSTLAVQILEDNALNYLSNVIEQSEQGLVFMTKDGKVAFRERLIETVPSVVVFTDSGPGVKYQGIQISFGTDLMVNQAVVNYPGGSVVSEDLTSQVTFGITEKTFDTQLSSLAQAEALADYIVARYSQPEYRIESVTVQLEALSDTRVDDVLSLELGDQADVVFRPNRVGGPVALRNRVIGISHDVSLNQHFVTFNFEELPFDFFLLDDPTFGRLDDDAAVLGF